MTNRPAEGVKYQKQIRREPIVWEGVKYKLDDGLRVLLAAGADAGGSATQRVKALAEIRSYASALVGSPWIQELVELYDPDCLGSVKIETLGCLVASEDPRAIPVFVKVIHAESDDFTRFGAAYGLARWNVRAGVGELIALTDSPDLVPADKRAPNASARLGDSALQLFGLLNLQKGWGFVLDERRANRTSERRPNDEGRRAEFIAEIKKWFAENEHRFPEWKPGDPLPEMPDPETDKSDK